MSTFKLKLISNDIKNTDMSDLSKYLEFNDAARNYFQLQPGEEHYKLLKYISLSYNDRISDVGTFLGASALAFSANVNVNVYTYDICDAIPASCDKRTPKERKNITFNISNCEDCISEIMQSKIILLDIDHSGKTEEWFVNKLESLGYDGILLLDDIYLNTEMQNFWNNVPKHLKKLDISYIGHYTGTGAIIFKPDVFDIVIE